MKPPAKENAARGVDLGGIESDLPGGRISDKDSPATPIAQRPPYLVVVDADVPRIWRECDTLAEAVAARAYLRGYVAARVLQLRGQS